MRLLIFWIFVICIERCRTQESNWVSFLPKNLTGLRMGSMYTILWHTTHPSAHHISIQSSDTNVILVEYVDAIFFPGRTPKWSNVTYGESEENWTGYGTMNLSANFIGYSILNVTLYNGQNQTLASSSIPASVLLSYENLNKIFTYIISVLIFIIYINMGASLDLEVVKQITTKPIGPLIGILCQYGLMPLFSFGLAKLYFSENHLLQLGMFLNGASPGGGASNTWTYLFGGSLDLSIMMTFCSTVMAFGAVPFWVLTLGPKLFDADTEFTIPYGKIGIMTASLVVPCFIGIAIQKFRPKVAKFLEKKVLPVVAVFNLVFVATVGIYSHRYIFSLFTWRVLLASISLPGLGYISGVLISKLFRRSTDEIIAIAIETGVQNANIPIVILKFTLPSPASDLAVVIPACIVMMTPLPLLCALIVRKLYRKLCNNSDDDKGLKDTEEGDATKHPNQMELDAPPAKERGEPPLGNGAPKLTGTDNLAYHEKL